VGVPKRQPGLRELLETIVVEKETLEKMNIPSTLKDMRLEYKLTLEELSELTGINRGLLSRYETGQTKPKYDNARKISEVFHVPVWLLYEIINRQGKEE